MDITILIGAVLISLLGMLGCIVPGLPGPPLNYIALLLVQFVWKSLSPTFLIVMAVITIIVLILDYLIPVWGAKKFGATKQGIRGSIIGMLVGLFLTPIGMMLGLLIGAFIGDTLAGKDPVQALKSSAGTFIGTMIGILIKLIVATIMCFAVFIQILRHLF